MLRIALTLIVACLSCLGAYSQCNGYNQLCDRKYNEVTSVMTHNAFNNTDDGFLLTNQTHNISQQLQDGVRGLMIDVYEVNGIISVYHGFSGLGLEPLSEDLGEIKDFLDNNPNEVVSIIFESHVTANDIENELANAGLMPYLHHHTLGTEWPTLQQMIDAGERLVIFSESDDGTPSQTWYHYAWAHVFDTNYSYSFPTDFDCDVNRGAITNDLYLVNHWITSGAGTGDITQANIVNANPFLINRLQQCQSENGRLPNFIGIDFYEIGSAFEAAEILNGITTSSIEIIDESTVSIFPNPVADYLHISMEQASDVQFELHDILGKTCFMTDINNSLTTIPCSKYPNGIYVYSLQSKDGEVFETGKVLIHH